MADENGSVSESMNEALRSAAGRGSQEANPFDGISSGDLKATWLDWRTKLGADDPTVKRIARELSRRGGHVGGGNDGGARGVDVGVEPDFNRMIREAAGRYVAAGVEINRETRTTREEEKAATVASSSSLSLSMAPPSNQPGGPARADSPRSHRAPDRRCDRP